MRVTAFFSFLLISCFHLSAFAADGTSVTDRLKAEFDHKALREHSDDDVKQLAQLYHAHGFQPLWTKDAGFNAATKVMVDTLKNADREGLDPTDYIEAVELVESGAYADALEAEKLISRAFLLYIDDLYGERFNPRRVHNEIYIKEKKIDAFKILQEGMASDPSGAWFGKLTVQHPPYQALKETLAHLRAQEREDYPVLETGKNLEKGDTDARVKVMQTQLAQLGYFDAAAKPALGKLDVPTDKALRAFQEDNRLEVDGILGPNTVAALNSHNLEDRINQVIVTMERWRWMPEKFPERYVMVNIAAFDLKAVEKGETVLEMPVIIGKRYRRTPVFSSEIYSVRFNPSWHVPRSIAVRDKLSKIKRDPGYLARGGYVLYDASGNRISPDQVNWGAVTPSSFNYRLRQVPGRHNALGKIRFTIRNKFNIYLHDTNQHELFKKANRSLSSGCIRISEPEKLGAFVYAGQEGFSEAEIGKRMQGTQTANIPVDNPVPVFINYLTVWHDDKGKAHFGRDIYRQDRAVLKAIKRYQGL